VLRHGRLERHEGCQRHSEHRRPVGQHDLFVDLHRCWRHQ
jgi:hypothetical protein